MKTLPMKDLSEKLIHGSTLKIGANYAKGNPCFFPGQLLQIFAWDFGEYPEEIDEASAVYNPTSGEVESIYHLFGNKLENFMDCEVITKNNLKQFEK